MSTTCVNASDPITYYTGFDVTLNNVSSLFPRLYQTITYDPCSKVSHISTVPLYTAIIGLVNGVVTYVEWDDGCFFCAYNGGSCISTGINVNGSETYTFDDGGAYVGCKEDDSACYVSATPSPSSSPASLGASPSPAASAANTNTTGALVASTCDLRVYVCWTGTDRNGRFLTSAGQRFSRYRAFGAATLYQNVLNGYDASVNIANSALDALQNVPGKITNN